jgi:hypothetical protein
MQVVQKTIINSNKDKDKKTRRTNIIMTYGLMSLVGAPLPSDPQFDILIVPLFLAVFFVFAIGKELGCQGYAFNLL